MFEGSNRRLGFDLERSLASAEVVTGVSWVTPVEVTVSGSSVTATTAFALFECDVPGEYILNGEVTTDAGQEFVEVIVLTVDALPT